MLKCQDMLHSGVEDHKMSKCREMLHPLIPTTDCCIGAGHDMLALLLSTDCGVGSFVFGSSKGQNAVRFSLLNRDVCHQDCGQWRTPSPLPPFPSSSFAKCRAPRGSLPALVKRRGGEGGG